MNETAREHWVKVDKYGEILQGLAQEIAQEISALWGQQASAETINETMDRLLHEKTQTALQQGIDLADPALWALQNAYRAGLARRPLQQNELRLMIHEILTSQLEFIQHGRQDVVGNGIIELRKRSRRIIQGLE